MRLAALKQKVAKFAQKEGINELGKKKFGEVGEKKDEKNLWPGTFFSLSQVNYHFQQIIFFKSREKNTK